jgi:hypothetical protein
MIATGPAPVSVPVPPWASAVLAIALAYLGVARVRGSAERPRA